MIKSKLFLTYKSDGLLWTEMLKQLKNLEYRSKSKTEIINFPEIMQNLCRRFTIPKAKMWNCLFFLKEFGLIEIIKYKGIRLCYELKQ